jgi:catechol 2,3-dioxygenase
MTMNQAEQNTTGQTAYGQRPPAYRLPAATRLGRVRLQVADLGRSLRYYQTVIGFRVLEESGGRTTLGAHGDDTPLLELHEYPGAAPVPRRGRLGLYHFAILLPDRPALARFASHLAAIGAGAGASDHLVSEAFYLQDPDGLGIEVYADRARSTWEVAEGQLRMATEPLDLEDLARAGGSEPWTGLPGGTVIGHVHLHVGDLRAAAAFYHEALGLDAVVWSYPGALFLSAGGYHHHLGLNTWAAGAPAAQPGDARLLDWELVVPAGADAAAASLRGRGYPVAREEGGWRASDPWGTDLRLRPG